MVHSSGGLRTSCLHQLSSGEDLLTDVVTTVGAHVGGGDNHSRQEAGELGGARIALL